MTFKFVRMRDGKRYFFPTNFFQDFGGHYLVDYVIFQRKIPKGAIDSEVNFSVLRILKGIGVIILVVLFLNAVF